MPRALSDLRSVVTLPIISNRFQPFNFSRRAINAVAVDDRTSFGIAAARSRFSSPSRLRADHRAAYIERPSLCQIWRAEAWFGSALSFRV